MVRSTQKTIRRQRRGVAWHWKQTDSWYFTPRGTKRRVALRDENGRIIRGLENKQAARLALARERLRSGAACEAAEDADSAPEPGVLVARVCSDYIVHCERAAATSTLHPEHVQAVARVLNEFSRYCGALPVAELKRGQVTEWVVSMPRWKSSVTRRNVLTTVISAFRHAESEHGIRNPLKGLKKPGQQPRLHAVSPADEQTLYAAVDREFRDFLFAAFHTGLRPFCELAKLRAENVEESPRGMLWRLRSSKTKKVRKVPVRPEVAKLVRRLLKTAPLGSGRPLFRNPQGNPWKKPTGVGRFLAAKRKLGWDRDDVRKAYSCYSCRHTFAYRMLAGFGTAASAARSRCWRNSWAIRLRSASHTTVGSGPNTTKSRCGARSDIR